MFTKLKTLRRISKYAIRAAFFQKLIQCSLLHQSSLNGPKKADLKNGVVLGGFLEYVNERRIIIRLTSFNI